MRRYLDGFLSAKTKAGREDPDRMPTLDEIKHDYIAYMLERTFWNKSLTARILNISRTALYDRLTPADRESLAEAAWLAGCGDRWPSH
jgi:DNA-binding NtrC family response regulator